MTAGERETRDRVRAFCQAEVLPVAQSYWERAEFPFELVPKLAALRIAGGSIEGYDCPGMSSTAYGLVLQELARADGSLSTFMGVQSSLAMNAIYYCGTEEQRRRWLPGMASMQTLGAFGLTEPEVGSDAGNLLTTATQVGDGYILNGQKRWIGNGTICDLAVIWARTEDGKVNGFVVPRDTPGYEATVIVDKLSKRSVWQADIELHDCRVPEENRLAGVAGFRGTATTLMHARLGVAWTALGQAISCFEIALNYAREREQFGRPIAGFQLVQEKLVRMLNQISLMQLSCLHLSRLRDQGEISTPMVAMAKMNNSEMARGIVRDARDILGGSGILGEYHIMRHLCDLESTYTYEGTYDINLLIVGREITGISAFT
ncbi:MAG: acyl-CoA dehydrogenase family protein [Pseudomonadota bacterium]|nr:acyl-CoA dehydrogenase family protein [Pseudomonadota bacterium]